MSRNHTAEDYKALAAEKELEFLGPVPIRVTEKTKWKCLRCGKEHVKSFSAVRQREKGCICQSSIALDDDSYTKVATALGITWQPKPGAKPRNNKQMTQWLLKDGTILEATYSQMTRRMPNWIKKKLGLPYKNRGHRSFAHEFPLR